MNRYATSDGFTFEDVPFDAWSGRQVAHIARTPEIAAIGTMADGLHLDQGTNHYPVVFVQTRPLLALPERAARVDHGSAVFVTPDGYMTKQWVNAGKELGWHVVWDESIRDYAAY